MRSAALLAFVLGRCSMKAIKSSRVGSVGHHHLGLGAGGSGKQTGPPSQLRTRGRPGRSKVSQCELASSFAATVWFGRAGGLFTAAISVRGFQQLKRLELRVNSSARPCQVCYTGMCEASCDIECGLSTTMPPEHEDCRCSQFENCGRFPSCENTPTNLSVC